MWGWLWLAAAAAGTWAASANPLSREQEFFHYEPYYEPLPTNLTIRPLSSQWHMNFTMKVNKSPPSLCVYMESIENDVKVQTFMGHCGNGKATDMQYLKYSLEANTWNTLQVRLADNKVLLQEPDGSSFILTDIKAKPPPHSLTAVTEVSGVDAAVGCAKSCHVHHYSSTELPNKVKEWQQERLHFYFRPAGPSSRLQYEVNCETCESTVSRREVEIPLWAEGTTAGWHLVELEQRQNRVTVRLNNTVLQDTELPGMCATRRHVISVVGGGSFSFKCTPPGATERTEPGAQRTTEERADFPLITMHVNVYSALTGSGLTLGVIMLVGGIVYYIKVQRITGNDTGLQETEPENEGHSQSPQGNETSADRDSNHDDTRMTGEYTNPTFTGSDGAPPGKLPRHRQNLEG